MFKKIKELKFKVKLAVMIFVIIFISTVILAIYSTIKVVQLENIIEEYKNPKPKSNGPFGKYFMDDDE